MSHYKKNASANRDALFGAAGPPSSKKSGGGTGAAAPGGGRGGRQASSSRPQQPRQPRPTSSSSASAAAASSTSQPAFGGGTTRSSRLRTQGSGGGGGGSRASSGQVTAVLTGAAKMAKMKEAEEYRTKAKKAMTRGVFSGPDPIAASNYYKRAADAYKQCGENRLERLHRIASGDCQMGQDAYATAASEYMRAAELAATSDEALPRKRAEVHKLYSDAANAWRQQDEKGRAGDCMMNAAFGLLIGSGDIDEEGGVVQTFESERNKPGGLMSMDKKALKAIEEAVEIHVPDVLNRYGSYRQIGPSAYVDPNADPSDATARSAQLDLAKSNMITTSYAHETVYKACYKLIRFGEYPSALYAAGAATTIIESDGFATISLARAFAAETVLTLALGDVVAAERHFLEVHLQKNSYLKSRECKLAEDLIRAVKAMDAEALEEARSSAGSNRAALANLDPNVRRLVVNLRVSGRAGRGGGGGGGGGGPAKKAPTQPARRQEAPPPSGKASAPPSQPKKKDDMLEGEELQASLDANFAELDALNLDMGLGSDDENDEAEAAGGQVEADEAAAEIVEEDDDDFDIDLR